MRDLREDQSGDCLPPVILYVEAAADPLAAAAHRYAHQGSRDPLRQDQRGVEVRQFVAFGRAGASIGCADTKEEAGHDLDNAPLSRKLRGLIQVTAIPPAPIAGFGIRGRTALIAVAR